MVASVPAARHRRAVGDRSPFRSGLPPPVNPAPPTANGRITPQTSEAPSIRRSIRSTPSTSANCEVAWRFKTDHFGPRPEFKLEGTPLMVKGVLYATAGTRRAVVAIDAATGELNWSHSYREGAGRAIAPRQLSGRGLWYWTDGKGDERILYVTTGYRFIALNAQNRRDDRCLWRSRHRRPEDGRLQRQSSGRSTSKREKSGCIPPPPSSGDVVIVGSSMKEGVTLRHPQQHKGHRSRLRRAHGKKGVVDSTRFPVQVNMATRPGRTTRGPMNGNTGVWSQITADEELGLVYLPVENPTSDIYGGHRPGDNLFGASLVCVDVKTGKRKWHFQLIHHPLWDYDISSAPILADIVVNGRRSKRWPSPPSSRCCMSSIA